MPDRDGYPLEEELKRVREWDDFTFEGYKEFFEFLRTIWNYATDSDGEQWYFQGPQQFWDGDNECLQYQISTGGWSGNEEIISVMRENFVLWSQTWYLHKRGGHFQFLVRVKQ